MKYIDADKLIAEIERRIEYYSIQSREGHELADLLSFIESLEKEQITVTKDHPLVKNAIRIEGPKVDLEKELSGWMGHYAYENGGEYPSAIEIARHSYDLGCRHTAEQADRIEFERQEREERENTNSPKIRGWVARDRGAVNAMDIECGGDLKLWPKVPYRNNVGLFWMPNFPKDYAIMGLPRTLFPELHWEDDPIEVELMINPIKNGKEGT